MRKVCELGRSMVEMLGVLAIIGVLSVGGIAGYSKAMQKYKINNDLNTLSQVIARMVELKTSRSLGGSIKSEKLKDVGFECDYIGGTASCKLSIGEYTPLISNRQGQLSIVLSGRDAMDSCTSFFSSKIYENVPSEWWYNDSPAHILLIYDSSIEYVYAKSEMLLSRGAKAELNASDISNVCSICDIYNLCQIYWYVWEE